MTTGEYFLLLSYQMKYATVSTSFIAFSALFSVIFLVYWFVFNVMLFL